MIFPRISIGFIFEKEKEAKVNFIWLESKKELEKQIEHTNKKDIILEISFKDLLCEEKKRLGLNPKSLVFVGTANISKSNWCMYQYYLKSIEEELDFFGAYISDRLFYSADLGLIKKRPNNVQELLEIGDNILLEDIEKLLKKKNCTKQIEDKRDPNNLTSLELGNYYENLKAEKLKTIRWNFRHKNLILLGVPDGLTGDYAYEFKYLGKKNYISTTLETAQYQANYYAINFARNKFKVQIYIGDSDELFTKEFKPSKENANSLLTEWIKMVDGNLPGFPYEKPYVCNSCKFKETCKIIG